MLDEQGFNFNVRKEPFFDNQLFFNNCSNWELVAFMKMSSFYSDFALSILHEISFQIINVVSSYYSKNENRNSNVHYLFLFLSL